MKHSRISILAHRGLWRQPEEKNSLLACGDALSAGFGIEVDIRDNRGDLIVAHDVNDDKAYPFSALGPLLKAYPDACLALNVKSCGLQSLIQQAIRQYGISRYFVFDMATPDLMSCLRSQIVSFTRQSEFEAEPLLYAEVSGVWMDMFDRDWIKADDIGLHLERGKDVALVSPELHGRPFLPFWQHLKESEDLFTKTDARCHLCTDHPEKALEFFYE